MVTVVEVAISIACAVISGVILHLYKKFGTEQESNYQKRVEADIADRELSISMAEALDTALKLLDGENLNGDVKAAQEDLSAKLTAVRRLTTKEYFETINKKG